MEIVQYTNDGPLVWLTLNRPEKRNALNAEMVNALSAALERAFADDSCKAILLKSEGKVFCSGADLESLQKMQTYTYDENLADSSRLKDLFLKVYKSFKPIVAVVQGPAIAGGCGLATVTDFTFAAEEAKFQYTEVRIGFVPALVSIFLVRKIGEGKARELLLKGDAIDAKTATQYGMINRAVPADELITEARKYALELCSLNSSMAMATTKSLINRALELDLKEALNLAAETNAMARASADCIMGVNSFLNKQPIAWLSEPYI